MQLLYGEQQSYSQIAEVGAIVCCKNWATKADLALLNILQR